MEEQAAHVVVVDDGQSTQLTHQAETINGNMEQLECEQAGSVSGNKESESEQTESVSGNKESESEPVAAGGSEETFDAVCGSCLENDKHVESFKYCVDCEEHLCEQCVIMHKGVRLTRTHELVQKESVGRISGGRKSRRELCSVHVNENIDWFCKEHKVLCCIVCKAIGHSKCGIQTLQEASGEFIVYKTITPLETIKSLICDTIRTRQTLQESLLTDKEMSLQAIQSIDDEAECVFQHIKSLVQEGREKVERTYKDIQKEIQDDIERHNHMRSSVQSSLDLLKSNMNMEYLFIHYQKTKENVRQIIMTLSESKRKTFRKIELEREKELDIHFEALREMETIGRVDAEKKIYLVIETRKIPILSQPANKNLDITSMCFTENNEIIALDWRTSCLYLLDTVHFDVRSVLQLKPCDLPFDVCKVEDKFAVSLLSKCVVTFITLRNTEMKLVDKKEINTVEKCRGICYHENSKMLFVACGGCGLENEGPGHIRVYNLEGDLQGTITENIQCPWKICLQKVTNLLFVCDENRLLYIQTNENKKYVCKVLKLVHGEEFCFDESGRIIFVETDLNRESTNVSLLTRTGDQIEILAERNLLTGKVTSIIFDKTSCCLYIAFDNSNFIHQFKLKVNDWKNGTSLK